MNGYPARGGARSRRRAQGRPGSALVEVEADAHEPCSPAVTSVCSRWPSARAGARARRSARARRPPRRDMRPRGRSGRDAATMTAQGVENRRTSAERRVRLPMSVRPPRRSAALGRAGATARCTVSDRHDRVDGALLTFHNEASLATPRRTRAAAGSRTRRRRQLDDERTRAGGAIEVVGRGLDRLPRAWAGVSTAIRASVASSSPSVARPTTTFAT